MTGSDSRKLAESLLDVRFAGPCSARFIAAK